MKNNCGFSMVELIIVIAIMAILAGALAPTLIKYVNKSRMTSDVTSASEIAKITQMALVDKEVAEYVFTKSMPYSVDVQNLDATDVFEGFILEKMAATPQVKYTKNGATCFQITIYETGSSGAAYGVEVTVKGPSPTSDGSAAANPRGDGVMLYPAVDAQYE